MKIEIDGCNFEVMYTKEPIIVDNKTCYGRIDYDSATILIDDDVADYTKNVSLLHEIVHGILDSRGFHEESADEDFVEQVARCLYSTLLHSPDLIKLIQKEQRKNNGQSL